MNSPLDQVTYSQDATYVAVRLVAGDDLLIPQTLAFDITGYTFSGDIADNQNVVYATLTVAAPQLTPTGIINFTLPGAQTINITDGSTWRGQYTNAGKVRTFASGPIQAVTR
jgi:hypothetical protein